MFQHHLSPMKDDLRLELTFEKVCIFFLSHYTIIYRSLFLKEKYDIKTFKANYFIIQNNHNQDLYNYILQLISLIYGEITHCTNLVCLNSDGAIIQEGAVEGKFLFQFSSPNIQVLCYSLKSYTTPRSVALLAKELTIIVEYALKKYKYFYKVSIFIDNTFLKSNIFLSETNRYSMGS